MKAQKSEIREIIESYWAQLDPDCRKMLANNRSLLDEIMGEMMPGVRRPRHNRRDE